MATRRTVNFSYSFSVEYTLELLNGSLCTMYLLKQNGVPGLYIMYVIEIHHCKVASLSLTVTFLYHVVEAQSFDAGTNLESYMLIVT